MGVPLVRCRNNPWMVAYFTLSFLSFLRGALGISFSRRKRTLICAIMFPATVVPSLVTSALGFNNIARRYFFQKPAGTAAVS